MDIPRTYAAAEGHSAWNSGASAPAMAQTRFPRTPMIEQLAKVVESAVADAGVLLRPGSGVFIVHHFLEAMENPTQEMLTAMGSTPGVAALTALAEAAGRAGLSHPGIPAVGQPSVMEQAWRAALGAAREAPAPKLAPVEGDEVLVRGAHRAALLGTRKDALEGLVAWVVYFTSADGPQGYDTVPYTSLVRR